MMGISVGERGTKKRKKKDDTPSGKKKKFETESKKNQLQRVLGTPDPKKVVKGKKLGKK